MRKASSEKRSSVKARTADNELFAKVISPHAPGELVDQVGALEKAVKETGLQNRETVERETVLCDGQSADNELRSKEFSLLSQRTRRHGSRS